MQGTERRLLPALEEPRNPLCTWVTHLGAGTARRLAAEQADLP